MSKRTSTKWIQTEAVWGRAWTFTDATGESILLVGKAHTPAERKEHIFTAMLLLGGSTVVHTSEHASLRDAMRAVERAKESAISLRTVPGGYDDDDDDDDDEKSEASD
jgi:hypothetical protein